MSTEQRQMKHHGIVMQQTANVRQILALPAIREMLNRDEIGVHLNMVGPIIVYQTPHSDESKQLEGSDIISIIEDTKPETPLLLQRPPEQIKSRKKNKTVRGFPRSLQSVFNQVFIGLPEPKLENVIRLTINAVHKRGQKMEEMAERLNCTESEMKSIFEWYNLST